MVVLVAAEVEVVVIMVVPVVHKDDSFKLGSLRIYVLHNSLSKKSREYRVAWKQINTQLLSFLHLYFQSLAENDLNTFEFKSLSDAVDEIKKTIDPSNIRYVFWYETAAVVSIRVFWVQTDEV